MDKLEKEVEDKLSKEVSKMGGKSFKFESNGNRGVPDRIVILPGGRIYFIETKRPKGGRFSKIQKFKMNELESLGCNVRSIKNYDEIDKFLEEVKR